MLNNIKLLLGITDSSKDELINLLINNAIEEIQLYTKNENICGCESLIQDITIYNFNRLGSEGLDSESYSGVRFDYSSDYPESIVRRLKAKRKLIIC